MATVHIRIDDRLKQSADAVFNTININPTQGVTAFYQYVADNGRLPFVIRTHSETPEELYFNAVDLTGQVYFMLKLVRNCLENEAPLDKTVHHLDNVYNFAAKKINEALRITAQMVGTRETIKKYLLLNELYSDITGYLNSAIVLLSARIGVKLTVEELADYDRYLGAVQKDLHRLLDA